MKLRSMSFVATLVSVCLCVGAAVAKEPGATPGTCSQTGGTYVNASGHVVKSPACSLDHLNGATARCRDGSESFSEHRSGTCSRHGGVAKWYR